MHPEEQAAIDFTDNELESAVHDHHTPISSHMVDSSPFPSSMVELKDANLEEKDDSKKQDDSENKKNHGPPKKKTASKEAEEDEEEEEEEEGEEGDQSSGDEEEDEEAKGQENRGNGKTPQGGKDQPWTREHTDAEAFQKKSRKSWQTTAGSSPRPLRGVLDFYGYAFLIEMDRQAWTKSFHKSIIPSALKKPYWEATGKMRVKLLRYPEDEKDRQTDGRKPVAEEDLDNIIRSGFVGEIQLKGWFDDLTNHFRGKVEEVSYIPVEADEVGQDDEGPKKGLFHKFKAHVSASFAKAKSAVGIKATPAGFMSHMFIPWREVDIRFDEQGAHVRFDWQYDESHRLDRPSQGIFSRMKNKVFKDVGYGIFRLDALPDENDKPPDKDKEHGKERADSTYQAMTYSRNIMSVMTLRMDSCLSTSEKQFTCVLEQRPMSASESLLYLDPPYGTEHGSWFTFLGTIGRLQLSFERVPDDNGKQNYEATPGLSWCGGFSPCPFVVHEPFKAQFLNDLIVLEQSEQGLEPAKRAVFHFYPLFKDESGEEGVNQYGYTEQNSITPKIKPDAHALAEQQKRKELAAMKIQLGARAKSEKTCLTTMQTLTGEITKLRQGINQLKKQIPPKAPPGLG